MKKKNELSKNEQPQNGSMAADLDEMDQLGKQMEKLRTNDELKKHREPGTEQFTDEQK